MALSILPGGEERAGRLRARWAASGIDVVGLDDAPATLEVEVGPPARGLQARLPAGPWCRVDLGGSRSGADPLLKAIRPPRAGGQLHVVDATGGWGVDAASMARAGAFVTVVERDPLVATLLEDALERARLDRSFAEVATRIECLEGDAAQLLPRMTRPIDVVYLDPMYEPVKGGAKRAPMELLRTWLATNRSVRQHGAGTDEVEDVADEVGRLIDGARRVALRRVVVKRAAKAPPVPGRTGTIVGRTTRFDLVAPLSGTDRAEAERSAPLDPDTTSVHGR